MKIELTKEELDKIVQQLGNCPASHVFEVLKLLEQKFVEACEAEKVKND